MMSLWLCECFRRRVLVGSLAVGNLVACSHSAEPLSSSPSPTMASASGTLGSGDVVEVRVFREPDLSGLYRVDSDGNIPFPMIGRILVAGQSPEVLSETLRNKLGDGYLNNPQVMVVLHEQNSQKVYVFGEVTKAGTLSYRQGMTVIEAITSAGGFTNLASTNSVRVTRVVDGEERRIELAASDIANGRVPNFQLMPGDIVFVPEALF